MTSGFLGSFSGALEGVTEAEAEEFRAQQNAAREAPNASAIDTDDENGQPDVPEEQAVAAANAAPARPPCTPEVDAAAIQFLAGTIYDEPRAAPSDIFEEPVLEEPRLMLHNEAGSKQLIAGEPILIGRVAPQSDVLFLAVDHDKVSREHCSVRLIDGFVLCSDSGSTNGTWVVRGNDVLEITDEAQRLQAGDKLTTMYNQILLAEVRNVGAPT